MKNEIWPLTAGQQSDVVASRDVGPDSLTDKDEAVDAIFAALGIEGSEFVAIPLSADAQIGSIDPGLTHSATGSETSETTSPIDTTWILHVDDDPDFRRIVKMRLEEHGIVVVNAVDGRQGIAQAMLHPASAIVLDYEMPNGQGDYALRRLKDNPITKDIPVIVLTGVRDKFLERRLLAMGAVAYLTKPPSFQQLLEVLDEHINQPSPQS